MPRENAVEYLEEPEGELLLEVNSKKRVMAEISEFNEVRYLNLRIWVETKQGWIRTRQGIPIPTKNVREFLANLNSYVEERRKR